MRPRTRNKATGEREPEEGVVRTDIQVEKWPLDRLITYARNARTHSDEQIAQVAASIVEFGWTNPILVGNDGVIIAGHARVSAARKLRMTEIPVIVLDHLSPTQRRALVLADNQLALNAGWDQEMLRVELDALREDSFDLELVGFSDEELENLLHDPDETNGGLTDEDAVPGAQEDVVTIPGDLWLLGNHRVLCGDATNATDVSRLLNGVAPALMATDPPYGVEYDPGWRADAGVNKNQSKLGKVQKAIHTKRITTLPDGKIDPAVADGEWERNTRTYAPAVTSRPQDDDEGGGFGANQYTKARAVREHYQARLAKLDYEERTGKLVSKDEVQIAAFNKFRQFRDHLLNIPDRLSALLAAESEAAAVYEVLSKEIRRALNDFSDAAG